VHSGETQDGPRHGVNLPKAPGEGVRVKTIMLWLQSRKESR